MSDIPTPGQQDSGTHYSIEIQPVLPAQFARLPELANDLYYSWNAPNGWTAAVPIDALNSGGSDLLPRLHPDGQTLYYTTAPIGGHATINFMNWPQLRSSLRTHQPASTAAPLY